MVNRFEDLAPLVAPTGVARGSTVGFRQGVVESWDPLTAENTIRIGGTLFTNLPSLASSSEVLLIKPGDVVSIKVVSGNSAFDTMYIEGRVTVPGTPQAGSFMELFGVKVAEVTSFETVSNNTNWVDLATPGPTVTNVEVGSTGRLLALWGATMQEFTGPSVPRGGEMSIQISGATSVPADPGYRYLVGNTDDGVGSGSQTTNNLQVRALAGHLFGGLNPGLHTVTAKYRCRTNPVQFGNRILIVIPF